MTEWREATLGELGRFQSGYAFPSRDWVDFGVPVIKIQNVRNGRVDLMGCSYVSMSVAAAAERYRVFKSDVLVTMSGEIGSIGIVRSDEHMMLNQRVGRLLLHEHDPLLQRFLGFALQVPSTKSVMETIAYGAAQANISPALLSSLPVILPSEETQRRVVGLLTSIDDLIENNRRRVEVLEGMARAIYREWFVHFRFPGHEDATFVDSDLGPIPEGWRASTCGRELRFVGGGTPSKREPAYWDTGTVDWFTPSDLTKSKPRYARGSSFKISKEGLARSSATLFPAGTVMMTSRATLGVLAIATRAATTNQGFISVLPDDRWPPNFIREYLDSSAEELAALGTGATFKEITKGSFKTFRFVLPAQPLLDEFRAATEAAEQSIRGLEQSAEQLAAIRDLLLPKLVTGQIDVSHLDLDAAVEQAGV